MATESGSEHRTPLVCTKSHILNCQFSSWYRLYKELTPKARIIRPLSRAFLDYLRSDGIVIPSADTSDDESDSSDAMDNPINSIRHEHDEINTILEDLNGTVVPKLNWSSPKDATWMIPGNTLKCTSADDVYLLLKSSDYVMHDLEHAFDDCQAATKEEDGQLEYELVLKEWFDLLPSMEFRCFVYNRQLVVSQRDKNHYEYLKSMSSDILQLISKLFLHLRDTFPDPNWVFDAYVQPRASKAWLLDVNPFAERTDTLLFEWEEIVRLHDDGIEDMPQLRLIPPGISPAATSGVSTNRVPIEMLFASQGRDLPGFAQEWQEMLAHGVADSITPQGSNQNGQD